MTDKFSPQFIMTDKFLINICQFKKVVKLIPLLFLPKQEFDAPELHRMGGCVCVRAHIYFLTYKFLALFFVTADMWETDMIIISSTYTLW